MCKFSVSQLIFQQHIYASFGDFFMLKICPTFALFVLHHVPNKQDRSTGAKAAPRSLNAACKIKLVKFGFPFQESTLLIFLNFFKLQKSLTFSYGACSKKIDHYH